jgi:hypothetical protein
MSNEVVAWLLDSDPSIRWQVMRDLLAESDAVVGRERARVASEGWGARLLDLQASDGHWGGGPYVVPGWIATTDTLLMLRELGLDASSERARSAVDRVRRTTWGPEFKDAPYFDGEEEACINGRVLACGAYFGEPSDSLVERLLAEQRDDGGWNCWPRSKRSSFHSTICVLEGLLEYERCKGAASTVRDARHRAHEYLLDRGLFRRLSTGEVVDPQWTRFSFPARWYYDVLRGLDYLRSAGLSSDARAAEAVELVQSKRDRHGRWPLENPHEGKQHFEMEGPAGAPSRWNTLRALRVLNWYSRS